MKIPKTFTIGKHKYTVEMHKHIPGSDSMGQISYGRRLVQIATHSVQTKKPYSEREITDTFWHEIVHAVLRDMGNDLEANELFVSAVADRLTDVIVSAKI